MFEQQNVRGFRAFDFLPIALSEVRALSFKWLYFAVSGLRRRGHLTMVWKPRRSSCEAHAKAVDKQLRHTKPGVVGVLGLEYLYQEPRYLLY